MLAIAETYDRLWAELTVVEEFRADETFVRGIRLPYQKFNRQPLSN